MKFMRLDAYLWKCVVNESGVRVRSTDCEGHFQTDRYIQSSRTANIFNVVVEEEGKQYHAFTRDFSL